VAETAVNQIKLFVVPKITFPLTCNATVGALVLIPTPLVALIRNVLVVDHIKSEAVSSAHTNIPLAFAFARLPAAKDIFQFTELVDQPTIEE